MATDNTLRIIIQQSELPKCIICLSDTPTTTIYSSSCACHPHIHEQCLALWITENPGVCPICRTKYTTDIVVIPQIRENIRCHLCACLFCTIMCITPFAVIIFLIVFKAH